MKPNIYLCGQITGLTQEQAKSNWRSYVDQELRDIANILCPMRSTESIKDEGPLKSEGYNHDSIVSSRGITTRDRWDVQRADLIFCNLTGSTIVSIGSMIELGWADALRKPVILCAEPDNIHRRHAMVREIVGFFADNVEDGIDIARRIV